MEKHLNFRVDKVGYGRKRLRHCSIVYLLFHYNSIVFSFFINQAATLYLKKLAKKHLCTVIDVKKYTFMVELKYKIMIIFQKTLSCYKINMINNRKTQKN